MKKVLTLILMVTICLSIVGMVQASALDKTSHKQITDDYPMKNITRNNLEDSYKTVGQRYPLVMIEKFNHSSELMEEEFLLKKKMLEESYKNNITIEKQNLTYLDLENIEISDSQVVLIGKIKNKDTLKKIHLEGELLQLDQAENILLGNMQDKAGLFEVIHFSINNNSNEFEQLIINDDFEYALNVYLIDRENKEFFMLEIDLLQNEFISDINLKEIFETKNNLQRAHINDLFWPTKVFEPISVQDKFEKPKDEKNISLTGALTYKQSYTNQHINLRYQFASVSYLEHAQIRSTIIYPENTEYNNDFTANVTIPYGYTKNENTGTTYYNEINIQVKNADIYVATEKTDLIHRIWWSKSTQTSSSLSVGISNYLCHPTFPYNWIGFEVNYTPVGTVRTPPQTFNSAQTHAKVEMDKDEYLNSIDHYFSLVTEIRRMNGGFDGNKDFRAKFSYDIDHPMRNFSRANYELSGTYYSKN